MRSTARRDISVDGENVGDQRQMRSVLLDGADRQHGHAVLRDGVADFGPGEFFVYEYLVCVAYTLRGRRLYEMIQSWHTRKTHGDVRPRTAVLTRGFDPSLSLRLGASRRVPQLHLRFRQPGGRRARLRRHGRTRPACRGERADLVYSRFSHPNAEILEDQIVPLEAGAREPPSSTPAWRRS